MADFFSEWWGTAIAVLTGISILACAVLLWSQSKVKVKIGADGKPLPGVATVAIQQGTFVGRRITQIGEGEITEGPFEYHDPGSMATIGRKRAVVQRGDLKFTGFIAWLAWLFVHLIKIMSFRNKLLVFIQWIWAYFTYQRGVRLITKR